MMLTRSLRSEILLALSKAHAEFASAPPPLLLGTSVGEVSAFCSDVILRPPQAEVGATLLEILRGHLKIDKEEQDFWVPPDQWAGRDLKAESVVNALLHISQPGIISNFIRDDLRGAHDAVRKVIFHGIYRAVVGTTFKWTVDQWADLVEALGGAMSIPDSASNGNGTENHSINEEECNALNSRYEALHRPLSSSLVICAATEIAWVTLSQAVADFSVIPSIPSEMDETPDTPPIALNQAGIKAATSAWTSVLSRPLRSVKLSDTLRNILEHTAISSLERYSQFMALSDQGLLAKSQSYNAEIASESLKLAVLCESVLMTKGPSSTLTAHLRRALDIRSIRRHPRLVQQAAVQGLNVLVLNYPAMAPTGTTLLKRFVNNCGSSRMAIEDRLSKPEDYMGRNSFDAANQSADDEEEADEEGEDELLSAIAKALSKCITVVWDESLILSTLYGMLNTLSLAKDSHGSMNSIAASAMHFQDQSFDQEASSSKLSNGYNFQEIRHRSVKATVHVVTRLVLELKREQITSLAVTMLLQTLVNTHEGEKSVILDNLVLIATISPPETVQEIITSFSVSSRSAKPENAQNSPSYILSAQTNLANQLASRPECWEGYLLQLLRLFAEKGTYVQTLPNSTLQEQRLFNALSSQVQALLLPIDALLAHTAFEPHLSTSLELITAFRNAWFIIILFDFVGSGDSSIPDWCAPSLSRIAVKTPALVIESAQNYLDSDIEYNSIMRKDYGSKVLGSRRSALARILPDQAHDIRSFTLAQITFLLVIFHVESMRCDSGRPSWIIWYFTNDGINHSQILGCIESLSNKVNTAIYLFLNRPLTMTKLSRKYCQTMAVQVINQRVDTVAVSNTIRNFMRGSCHRYKQVRKASTSYLEQILYSFPGFIVEETVLTCLLEILTMLSSSVENQMVAEYMPTYDFSSELAGITLQLSDSYEVRSNILTGLTSLSRAWILAGQQQAPIQLQSILMGYLDSADSSPSPGFAALGRSIALEFVKNVPPQDRKRIISLYLPEYKADESASFLHLFSLRTRAFGEITGLRLAWQQDLQKLHSVPSESVPLEQIQSMANQLANLLREVKMKTSHFGIKDLQRLLWRCAAMIVSSPKFEYELLHQVTSVPFKVGSHMALSAARDTWTWIINERPLLEPTLMAEICTAWKFSIKSGRGLFSPEHHYENPFNKKTDFTASDKGTLDMHSLQYHRLFSSHELMLEFLSSRFTSARYHDRATLDSILEIIFASLRASDKMNTQGSMRYLRFSLLNLALDYRASVNMELSTQAGLMEMIYSSTFEWFASPCQWLYGSDRIQLLSNIDVMKQFAHKTVDTKSRKSTRMSAHSYALSSQSTSNKSDCERMELLRILIENEIYRLTVWANPLNDAARGQDFTLSKEKRINDAKWAGFAQVAWSINPAVAIHMIDRFKRPQLSHEIHRLVMANADVVCHEADVLQPMLKDNSGSNFHIQTLGLSNWNIVPPVTAISLLLPSYGEHPLLIQYALRCLSQHPIDVTFFYVPQVVQALRTDSSGYVAQFVRQTAQLSQLFCHQIIWNMKANTYKDDMAVQEDPCKALFEMQVDSIVHSLSGEAREFYEREFKFFDAVTSISGKLKPFIKESKLEKKRLIDKEMSSIEVDSGVYLPSNPDGVVIDLDKKSGRPLQSHAKAPFMATFKVRRETEEVDVVDDVLIEGDVQTHKKSFEVWQQAIFKVGDDCRQDVLALQIIAMFKDVFTSVGLPLYLYPYRVTATGPGCGVIDVVPDATSRDEMGRNKINDLFTFFTREHGNIDTLSFQKARVNFIQSMAAYSLICYILQVKDRHNGNILIDGHGHIVHIDFGFLFDIGPGGVKFEPNSFKLNHEMVTVIGGPKSPGYKVFCHLVVKGFLAVRLYANQIVDACHLMLGTDLPSFKGEETITRLRDRFQLQLNDRDAAHHMMNIINNAFENVRSSVYDAFQKAQNGIPY